MGRVEIGEKKTDGDRFDAFRFQRAGRGHHPAFIKRIEFVTVRRREPSLHHLAVTALDQRPVLPRQFLHDRIMLDALMAGDMDDVAEALVGQHAGTCPLVLQHRVGRGGGAMQHVIDIGRRDAIIAADFGYALNDAARRIVRRGRNLVNGDLIGAQVAIHDVGECAADVDTNRLHDAPACMLPRLALAC